MHRQLDPVKTPSLHLPLHYVEENRELREALEANSRLTSADILLGNERVYAIPKEKVHIVTDALEKSEKVCYIIFNDSGTFVYAEADTHRRKQEIVHNRKKND